MGNICRVASFCLRLGGSLCLISLFPRTPYSAGCAIWNNWWPALTAILYVIVPMPYIFFGGSSSAYSDTSSSGWLDAGKFLTGFSLVGEQLFLRSAIGGSKTRRLKFSVQHAGVFAIPSILAHAKAITSGALALELVASVFLCLAALAFDWTNSEDE